MSLRDRSQRFVSGPKDLCYIDFALWSLPINDKLFQANDIKSLSNDITSLFNDIRSALNGRDECEHKI